MDKPCCNWFIERNSKQLIEKIVMKEVVPYKDLSKSKKEQVALMFDNISGKYDKINRLMTFGIDQSWRRKSLKLLLPYNPKHILDVATGTGDFAIQALKVLNPNKIVGVDISEGMLDIGKQKLKALKLEEKISLVKGDSEKLPFESNIFDAVTVAYGVRNFENLEAGLAEILRVLRPGGRLVILEATEPQNKIVKFGFDIYAKKIIPFVGSLISGDSRAYDYLQESVAKFPQGNNFIQILNKVGYTQTKWIPLTFGASSIYTGCKEY